MAEFEQYAPIIEATLLGAMNIIGGTEQQRLDNTIAKHAQTMAAINVAQQRRLNRSILSDARMRSLQSGTDRPNLTIIMQLALEGNLRVSHIKNNGDVSAWYYRNLGDQALYASLGAAGMALGVGFADAYEKGLFTKDKPKTSPVVRPAGTAPGTSGSGIAPSSASRAFAVI